MIFSVIDFIMYCFQMGKYSKKNIQKAGGKLATKENFSSFNDLKPPVIIFLHTRFSMIAWIVMYYTNGIFSHTSMYIGNGKIVDANIQGVGEYKIEDYLDNKSYLTAIQIDTTEDNLKKIHDFTDKTLGAKYNWLGVINFYLIILFGKHDDYRVKFTLDYITLFLFLYYFNYINLFIFLYLSSVMITVTMIFSLDRVLSKSHNKSGEPIKKDADLVE